jgi:competence protein ComEC
MLLNDRGSIQHSQKKLFARTGVAHLLAISGLHIGMIGLMLEFFLRLLRFSKRQRRIPCIVILGLYTWIIGAPPSAVRAFLMLTYLWSACFFSRKATSLSAISFAGILSLLTYPHQLWDWGFQFSYVAVLCIILIGNPLASCLSRRFRHPPDFSEKTPHSFWKYILRRLLAYLLQSGCISVPISLLTIPLSLEYFGSFSLSGIVINLVAIPLAFGIIVGGFGTIAIGLFLGNSSIQWILQHWLQPYTCFFENILHWCDLYLPYFWEDRNLAAGTGIATFFIIGMLSLVFHHLHLKNFLRMQTNPTKR